jgi:photosystem II stability/assembly factor-like uncharacterized protein
MKKYFLLLCCTLLCVLLSYGQDNWQWLNPQPSGYNNSKVVFVDHQRGFILNINGDLEVTTDQGASWGITDHFPYATSFDVHANTGVIASYTGVLYLSQDNGNSWQFLQPDTIDQFAFVNVLSRDSFFVSTASGTIYATEDMGHHWAEYHCGAPIECLSWVNSMIGFVGSTTGAILKTVDGGKTWKVLNSVNYSPGNITAIDFPNADTGYACRSDSVLITYDGGNTWQEHGPRLGYTPYAIDFVNSTTGIMAGESGTLLRSNDGGVTWTFTGVSSNAIYARDLTSLTFVSVDTGFAIGQLGQIWKTVDTGNTWTSYSPSYANMYEACFPSPAVGYAVSRNNIFKTLDGGKTWNQLGLAVGTNYADNTTFSYVHFSTPDSGYAISTGNVAVYKTGDGGLTWTKIVPTGYSYEAATGIWYGGRDTAVLCMGTAIVQTVDGGNTWSTIWTVASSQASGPPYILGNIFYVNPNVWYAAYYQNLYKTTNGGQSWTQVYNDGDNYTVTGMWFFNAQQGFIVDEEGYISMTSDGGNSWKSVKQNNVYDEGTTNGILQFYTPQVGYFTNGSNFVGSWGRIYKTVDGGQTWQVSHTTGGVSIDFTPDSGVVVAGFGGSILKEPIGGSQVDSLSVTFNNSCGTILSASVGAALGTVDSIQFEITSAGGQTTVINASPAQVVDDRTDVSTTLNGLLADTLYSARVKLRFNGTVAYSDTVAFVGVGLVTPYIIDSVGVLVSSAPTGNQWFLDGQAIAGATQQRYSPNKTGNYTVQARENNCVSAMSAPVVFRANDLGVILYPNPTRDFIFLENTQGRTLAFRILDMSGRTVMTSGSGWYYGIYVAGLDPGEYVLEVIDKNNGQKAGSLFLKL